MARPSKADAERRTRMIRFRVTESELTQFKQAAETAGLTVSDHARVKSIASLPRSRKPTPERAAFIRALAELGKIGSNLNQIARSFNRRDAAGGIGETPDARQVAHTLAQADALGALLMQMLEHGH